MLIMEKIETEIREREQGRFSGDNCAKLADLYIIRENLSKHSTAPARTMVTSSAANTDMEGESEFLRCASRIDSADALKVMDDMMKTLRESHPKLYENVMQQMRQL